jgi:hypothetical protein
MMSAGQPVAHLGLKKQSITIVFSKLTNSAPKSFLFTFSFAEYKKNPKSKNYLSSKPYIIKSVLQALKICC